MSSASSEPASLSRVVLYLALDFASMFTGLGRSYDLPLPRSKERPPDLPPVLGPDLKLPRLSERPERSEDLEGPLDELRVLESAELRLRGAVERELVEPLARVGVVETERGLVVFEAVASAKEIVPLSA